MQSVRRPSSETPSARVLGGVVDTLLSRRKEVASSQDRAASQLNALAVCASQGRALGLIRKALALSGLAPRHAYVFCTTSRTPMSLRQSSRQASRVCIVLGMIPPCLRPADTTEGGGDKENRLVRHQARGEHPGPGRGRVLGQRTGSRLLSLFHLVRHSTRCSLATG